MPCKKTRSSTGSCWLLRMRAPCAAPRCLREGAGGQAEGNKNVPLTKGHDVCCHSRMGSADRAGHTRDRGLANRWGHSGRQTIEIRVVAVCFRSPTRRKNIIQRRAPWASCRKTPNSIGKMSPPGFPRLRSGQALRLRGISAVSIGKAVRRCAQDDDFVGVLTKNIRSKLSFVVLRPWLVSDVPAAGTTFGNNGFPCGL